jgi:hypothetical protein
MTVEEPYEVEPPIRMRPIGLPPPNAGESQGPASLDYEVVFEPMDEPGKRTFPPELDGLEDDLHEMTLEEPELAVARLQDLVKRYPGYPTLMNWLAAALMRAGREFESDTVIELLYERHPDYLFAKVGYAELMLRREQFDKVPQVLGHRFDLKLLYPQRTRFHYTEFVALSAVVAQYLLEVNRIKEAEPYIRRLIAAAPDHPATERIEQLLALARLRSQVLSRKFESEQPGERPRKKKGRDKRKRPGQ